MSSSYRVKSLSANAEEMDKVREAKAQLNAEAAANWENPQWRKEMAAALTDEIYWGFEHENLLSLMTEVRNVGFDDRVLIKEVRGLRAFWIARGGVIEASTLHAEVMEMPRDTIGFHVYEFVDKIRTNFAETQATVVQLGIQRMDAEINKRFLKLLQAAVPSSSSSYLSGASISLDTLNTALREVRDESYSFDVVVVGRHTMTDQIMDKLLGSSGAGANFLLETNEDLIRRGVLGNYRGARIVSLNNYKDDTETAFFPANELFVIAPDASQFAFWGGPLSKEYEEDDNWYWHYIVRRDCGGVVHRPERIRRIVDTNIAP